MHIHCVRTRLFISSPWILLHHVVTLYFMYKCKKTNYAIYKNTHERIRDILQVILYFSRRRTNVPIFLPFTCVQIYASSCCCWMRQFHVFTVIV